MKFSGGDTAFWGVDTEKNSARLRRDYVCPPSRNLRVMSGYSIIQLKVLSTNCHNNHRKKLGKKCENSFLFIHS